MLQVNLLPDIKLEYIKAQRARRLVMSVSMLVTILAVIITVTLFGYGLAQKKHLKDLNRDIVSESQTLQNKPGIAKILTVQNQLESLTQLHENKPYASQLFDYLNKITPGSVYITQFHVDFTQYTMTITGTADSLKSVNQFVDTIKAATYTTSSSKSPAPAFSNVVLSSFGFSDQTTTIDPKQAASYTITLAYDKNIFDITQSPSLTVPSSTANRSQITQPDELFKASTTNTQTNGGAQ